MISPVKFETNSRPPTKVRLSRPGVSCASTVCSPLRGSMRSTCPLATWVETMKPVGVELHRVGHPEIAGNPLRLTAVRDRCARSRWRSSAGK